MIKESVIAIDGPSGSGKSTVAKIVAQDLDFLYIDTGSMFRAIAYGLIQNNVDLNIENDVSGALESIHLDYYGESNKLIAVNGIDVTNAIREHHISDAASKVSRFECIREKLKNFQRSLAKSHTCVLEGRDIGTVVFPNAKLKIFLTASSTERAKRRFEDLKNRNILNELTYEKILEDIEIRDKRDSSRDIAPLIAADDAKLISSDNLNIDEVVAKVKTLANKVF